MSDRIRGRPPGGIDVPQAPETDAAKTPDKGVGTKGKSQGQEPDKFEGRERAATAPPSAPMDTRLQALAGKTAALKVQFTNVELAELASVFAQLLTQHPNANRLKRARLFTKAILKRKRLRRVFGSVPEAEMEQMCDEIADVLDSSPVFGQLVDDVTDGANKNGG